jgi:hypothetical protein
VKESAVTAAEVMSVSKTEKKSLSLAKNSSPVKTSSPDILWLPIGEQEEEDEDEDEKEDDKEQEEEDEEEDVEVAKVVNIVSTCVTAIWLTVIAFKATRWVVEASLTSVVVDDPDIIWTVVASEPVCSLNSS